MRSQRAVPAGRLDEVPDTLFELPEPLEQPILTLVADVMLEAASVARGNWGLKVWDPEFRLSVGWTEIVHRTPDRLRLIADGEMARAAKLPPRAVINPGKNPIGFYKTIPGSVEISIPITSTKAVIDSLPKLWPAIEVAVRLAGQRGLGSGVRAGHDEKAVRRIGRLLGKKLPQPSYLTPIPPIGVAERDEARQDGL